MSLSVQHASMKQITMPDFTTLQILHSHLVLIPDCSIPAASGVATPGLTRAYALVTEGLAQVTEDKALANLLTL